MTTGVSVAAQKSKDRDPLEFRCLFYAAGLPDFPEQLHGGGPGPCLFKAFDAEAGPDLADPDAGLEHTVEIPLCGFLVFVLPLRGTEGIGELRMDEALLVRGPLRESGGASER